MTERIALLNHAGGTSRLRPILSGALVQSIEHVLAWHACSRDRRLLASHDDRTLRDMGIDRAMVEDESCTSFWRLR